MADEQVPVRKQGSCRTWLGTLAIVRGVCGGHALHEHHFTILDDEADSIAIAGARLLPLC